MRGRRRRWATCAAVAAAATIAASSAGTGPATAADPAYQVREGLHFKVVVGPQDQTCDIVGDLYVPEGASTSNRMPAILSTNGFGGSKDDQDALSAYAAAHGYVALTYSGLGFGGSSCEITLDDPDFDGEAASQLIDFLGGAEGIAFTDKDHTAAVPALDVVQLDGAAADQDPRVGMVGGSYGGQVQYAAASMTDKLDTIVPVITWNDLSYSLAPNNTDQVTLPGQEFPGVSTEVPGAAKMNWALGFSAIGAIGDVQNQQPDNPLATRCPNFRAEVCPALVYAAATGTMRPGDVAFLRHASVASYQDKVTIPTLILQGQADTLFNLNEAIATYQALKAQGTPVKMSWIEYGHSGPPAAGELDLGDPNPATQHITKRIFDWFDHYLQDDSSAPTGPEFSYFRDWVRYDGIASPAYANSDSFPVGTTSTYLLSSTSTSSVDGGALVTRKAAVQGGTTGFTTPAGGAPASDAEDADVLGNFFERPQQAEHLGDLPGTFARYDTDPLSRHLDVVGSPRVRLRVQAPTAAPTQTDDAGKLVLFLKIEDVDPDGRARVVRNLAAPIRVPDVNEPFTVTMPAFVHRFEAGHSIRLVIAGASPNYRGTNAPTPVTITTAEQGSTGARAARALPAQSVTLPTLQSAPTSTGDTDGTPGTDPAGGDNGSGKAPGNGDTTRGSKDGSGSSAAQAAAAAGAASSAPYSSLADTGGPAFPLLLAGALLVVMGGYQVRRARTLGSS